MKEKIIKTLISVGIVLAADLAANAISGGIMKGAKAIKAKSKKNVIEEVSPEEFKEV